MEKIILGGGSLHQHARRIEGGGSGAVYPTSLMLLLESTGSSNGMLGLTNLNSCLAKAKDDLC